MSMLTYLTAPWSLGLIFQVLTGRRPWRYLLVAAALLLFSSSWFYDGYLFWRDGAFSTRWAGNLMLSPIIYVCAGLLWNLEPKSRFGFRFSFVRADWPSRPVDTRFTPLIAVSIPLMVIAAFVLVAFVRW
jgi:glucose-6-phosphate-specific signal transduction histidine kinase